MELDELKHALLTTDPATVLVAPRILRRLLQAQFEVPYVLVHVPHERCYFFDRQVLFSHVEQDELELEADRLLPATVILLAKPSVDQPLTLDRDVTLLTYWRLLFHIHVHLALHQRCQDGKLTPAEARLRVEQIGRTEFEEIRTVLQQENYLLPPADDLTVYVEFAALYLELRYFRTNLRATYFPALANLDAIDQLLAQDVEADSLFARTRLPGAPLPVVRTDTSSDESHEYYSKLMRQAQRAGKDGDIVRAAILRTRAARVAPVALTRKTCAEAVKDLEQLTGKLQSTLKFSDQEAQDWLQVLPALLDKADQGNWPVEAKLLYDLQTACLENQRRIFALDVVEWVISAGRRPIKRPLTSLQTVRITKNLRSAAQRLTTARVSDEDRQRLAKLLQSALQHCENRLRERFRPILRDAFQDVGLVPTNLPERVAFQKIIEELLDRIAENGFFTFSDLRDSLSRNQLKQPDLTDPYSFWRGDPLLRLDRRLATLMEGVYRHGEFYLRWLESSSSLFFGTEAGRFMTRNLLVPFGGAYVALKGMELFGRELFFRDEGEAAVPALPWFAYVLVGFFLLGLIHWESLRTFFTEAGRRTYRWFRLIGIEIPVRVWRQPLVRTVLQSWPFLLLYWYLIRPLPFVALLALYWPTRLGELTWLKLGAAFFLLELLLNSRFGYAASEACTETAVLLYGWLRFDVIQGLVRWLTYFFKEVTETVEYVLYSVDEWLRFRSDESQLTQVLRGLLGVVWFPIGYLTRLYFLMLIEPSVNPLKLPISILAAKFFYLNPHVLSFFKPVSDERASLIDSLALHLGGPIPALVVTFGIIVPTVWLLPSAFAFFCWEMRENWRLFRANRPARLRPVVVGRHGETVLQLLRPGAHSGTIPHLFGQLRHAERTAYHTDNWRSARTYRQALKEVSKSVQVFVERELLELLRQSHSWSNQPVRVGQVMLSCNCIRVELIHEKHPGEPIWLVFEERNGWLLGNVQGPGWLRQLNREHLQVLSTALIGLYKIAGVNFIREHLDALVSPSMRGYDLTDHQMIMWKDRRSHPEISLDLWEAERRLLPLRHNGPPGDLPAIIDARSMFFSRVPLTWEQWVACWQQDQEGLGLPPLLGDSVSLLGFADGPA